MIGELVDRFRSPIVVYWPKLGVRAPRLIAAENGTVGEEHRNHVSRAWREVRVNDDRIAFGNLWVIGIVVRGTDIPPIVLAPTPGWDKCDGPVSKKSSGEFVS